MSYPSGAFATSTPRSTSTAPENTMPESSSETPRFPRSPSLVWLAAVVLSFSVVSAAKAEERPETPPPPDGWSLGGDAAAGKERFVQSCALCHGEDGSGEGRLPLDPPARDLRDPEARIFADDWGTFVVVRDGGRAVGLSPRMLAYGKLLDEDQLRDVVAFVQSLMDEESSE